MQHKNIVFLSALLVSANTHCMQQAVGASIAVPSAESAPATAPAFGRPFVLSAGFCGWIAGAISSIERLSTKAGVALQDRFSRDQTI